MSNSSLQDILKNTSSGASDLYSQVLSLFISNEKYQLYNSARKASDKLCQKFPEMAVFQYLKGRITNHNGNLSPLFILLKSDAETESENICSKVRRFWRKKRRVVTISQSSMVLRVLKAYPERIESVLLSVSSPKNEGILMARKLALANIKVTVVTDAALPGMITQQDYIFTGADTVTERYIVNKTGTYALALAAQVVKAKVLTFCESFKFIEGREHLGGEPDHPRQEILRTNNPNIHVNNHYFEKIPRKLIYRIITGSN
ncbi:MAG: hypothetical protein KAR42_09605 [candidate division Zixibacteria bacterium]|nr:hypothetical protein [candidate division Zixibacteria bacterium]